MTFTFTEVASIAVWIINSLAGQWWWTVGVVIGAWLLIKLVSFIRSQLL
jgi:hypothetical protein